LADKLGNSRLFGPGLALSFALRRGFWYKVALDSCWQFYSRHGINELLNFKHGKWQIMSRVCQVTGKRPVTGNNVSHAKNRTRRRFLPNLHNHRFWLESEKRFVSLRVSAKGMRIIDKKGIESVLADIRARGEKV